MRLKGNRVVVLYVKISVLGGQRDRTLGKEFFLHEADPGPTRVQPKTSIWLPSLPGAFTEHRDRVTPECGPKTDKQTKSVLGNFYKFFLTDVTMSQEIKITDIVIVRSRNFSFHIKYFCTENTLAIIVHSLF